MEHILKESILQELINKAQWPTALSLEKVTSIVYRGLDMLKGAGIGFSSFEDGKKPAIGDIIGIAGKLSGEVGKLGLALKGAEKLQTVMSVVDVLLSYLEGVKPAWAEELEQLKGVARDVLPASLSFAVSVSKGEFDLGSVLRKPEGVAHLDHGRSLLRRFLGFVRRLTPALALCGVSGAAAAAVEALSDRIEEAPRPVPKPLEVVEMPPLNIQSEKEPVAPPPTPRPSLEEPLPKEEVPQQLLAPVAEEVRSSSPVQESSAPAPSSPVLAARQVLHDA